MMFRQLRQQSTRLQQDDDLPSTDEVVREITGDPVLHADLYNYNDLMLHFETLAGETRSGTSPTGETWSVVMPAHYGEIVGTVGGDGDPLDIYLCDTLDPSITTAYIIDQVNLPDRSWDEHKIMLGFASQELAEATYALGFSDGKGAERIGAITPIELADLRAWAFSDKSSVPFAYQAPTSAEAPTTLPPTPPARRVVRFGGEVITLPKATGPAIVERSVDGHPRYDIFLLNCIESLCWRSTVGDITRILHTASPETEVVFHIASYGGELNIAARLASAMRASQAKITTIACGPVCSAAAVIWAEGQTRVIDPGAYFMQHMSSHGDYGNSAVIARQAASMANYVVLTAHKRQLEIGLLTDQEVADMVDKARDIYIDADVARQRTGG